MAHSGANAGPHNQTRVAPRNCPYLAKLHHLTPMDAVRLIVRDRKRPSRRLLLQSGGAVVTSTMLGMQGAVGAETGPGVPADTPTGRRPTTLDPDYFKGMYATEADPWRFATSAYERDKYAATLAALPRSHYVSGLDVGCSIGVFTHQL